MLFLWIGFVLSTVVAFFAIVFTGRHLRGLFDFKVGVLRWSWRVSFYSFSALGTDRYPPFTLRDVPDYPARVDVEVVAARAAHYLVVGVFAGGAWAGLNASNDGWAWSSGGGLISLLVLIAGVVLLFTTRYPRAIFEFVMGTNRWVYRVIAYGSLMTDAYPPFRLDMGGEEPTPDAVGSDVILPTTALGGTA